MSDSDVTPNQNWIFQRNDGLKKSHADVKPNKNWNSQNNDRLKRNRKLRRRPDRGLNNRLGAVYQAVGTFLQSRQKDGQEHKFSIVLYTHECEDSDIICQRVVLSDQNVQDFITRECLNKTPCGGTSFGEAMYRAEQIMKRNPKDHYIIMFLTDGSCSDGCSKYDSSLTASQRVKKLFEEYKMTFYGIQFSTGSHSQALINMAKEGGNKPIKDSKMPADLGNFFISAVASETDVWLMKG